MLGAAEQVGVRTTRMLKGEYVVTKDDVVSRRYFPDTVCRGRDYYTPYRALLPRKVDQLIVAGRHYSAEPEAQKRSREIPPCMVQGEAAGVAAAIALDENVNVARCRLPQDSENDACARRRSRRRPVNECHRRRRTCRQRVKENLEP